jgi:methionyl-tRNA formyltransferase
MGERDASCPPHRLGGPSRRLVLFGDTAGLPQLLRVPALSGAQALVAASIRPGQHDELAALAKAHALPLLLQPQPQEAGYGAFVSRLRELAPDLLIVNSYAMILRPNVLAIPRFGAVNVHGALLPAYRGANPTEWALINGERETGVTIHAIDEGIDTGPIIAQRKVPVRFEDTWIDLRRRVAAATEGLLAETLPSILAGDVSLASQSAARKAWPRRRAEDGHFAWSQPAIDIYNLVRALVDPHPGASVDTEVITRRLSLSEILWRKRAAGYGSWSSDGWDLLPRRPGGDTSGDESLAFDIRYRAGPAIGSCEILQIADASKPVTARLSLTSQERFDEAALAVLRALVARVVGSELRRDVR